MRSPVWHAGPAGATIASRQSPSQSSRSDCTTDSRGAEVALTEGGAQLFRRATLPHMRAIKKYFADALTPEQFEALAGVLQALQDHLRGEAGGNQGGQS